MRPINVKTNNYTIIMKKFTLPLLVILLFAVSSVISQTVNVTFRVDMKNQIVPPEGVHLAGDFQDPLPNWNPSGIALTTPAIGNVWQTTLQLQAGETIEYKFINGDDWGLDESVYGSCGAGNGNRVITIPSTDTTLLSVCFGSCLPCVVPQVDVTFQVDMSNETVSGDGVFVAGSFNEWQVDSTEMLLIGNSIYAATLQLDEGAYYEYKFLNGNQWETVPSACSTGGYSNRDLTVPPQDTTLPAVCFSSCDLCSALTDVNVTFQVDMSNKTVSPEGVHIAGSFQGWVPDTSLMTDNGSGMWSYTTTLTAGNYFEYKFINGITWDDAENVFGPCNQNGNRYLTAPDSDTTLPALCFGSCNICNPPLYDVTFTVDLSTQTISPIGVYIVGSFNNWDTTATQMTNSSGDYYQVTLSLGENDYHEFKYLNGNSWANSEYVPEGCNSYDGNRYLTIPGANTTLDTVCFSECDACTNQLYSFNLKVLIEGPFNGAVMNTDLYDLGFLPDQQPYNTAPWSYDGTEYLNAPPDALVVDWVLVEFRETDGDASTATSDKFLDHQAALLLEDGSIVKPDGVNPIQYTGDIIENLYAVIYHRNHLAVMSGTALNGLGNVYSYNFTYALSKAYLDGQKDLTGGFFGMIAGDSDGSGIINADDKDVNWNGDAGKAGYFGSDLNLDSQVNNPDKNDLWETNLGEETKVPTTSAFSCGGPLFDERDGQSYATVQIGTQCWMAENLNLGTMINSTTGGTNNDGEQTSNGIFEKYCYDNNLSNCDTYGGLYQWDEMMQYSTVEGTQGICPSGWHLPTDAEWCTLEQEVDPTISCSSMDFRGVDGGGKLKDTGSLWAYPNAGATNSSGFTALPGGYCTTGGTFGDMTFAADFWSSTGDSSTAWYRGLSRMFAKIARYPNSKTYGYSVRCLKDF